MFSELGQNSGKNFHWRIRLENNWCKRSELEKKMRHITRVADKMHKHTKIFNSQEIAFEN